MLLLFDPVMNLIDIFRYHLLFHNNGLRLDFFLGLENILCARSTRAPPQHGAFFYIYTVRLKSSQKVLPGFLHDGDAEMI